MKTTTQLLGAVSAFALVAVSSAPAMAAGTTQGTVITNTVQVDYQVGGVNQNQATASDSFTVDRRVNLTVTNIGPATTVNPGQQNAVLAFDVTNSSNDAADLVLTTALTSGTAANISNYRIYRDTNGNSTYDAGDALVTYLDDVAADTTVRVFVLSNISTNAANGNAFNVTLTARAHAAGAVGTQGAVINATAGANGVNTVDNVLFDGAGATDAANDGAFSATGIYNVAGAVLTVLKTSRVVSDPVNGITNPKAIPGATVEYCITVANAAGAATATAINLTDDLPNTVTYSSAFGTFINGNATCTSGTAGGTFSAGGGAGGTDRVRGTLSDIAAGQTRSLYFRVTIK
jgi:hypothetical protein